MKNKTLATIPMAPIFVNVLTLSLLVYIVFIMAFVFQSVLDDVRRLHSWYLERQQH
jgi:hypothetical protein